MDDSPARRAKLFIISFLASFFMLSLFFLFLTTTMTPKTPASLAADIPAEEEYIPRAEDAMTLLVFGAETPDAVAGTYMLIRFDPVGGRVLVAAPPPQTMLEHGGKTESLSDAYRYGGARYTRDALAEYLGIPIDRYARISINSFVLAAGAVGTVEFELEEPLTLMDGDAEVTLGKGVQLLDGRKVAGIIRRGEYPGGEAERQDMITGIVCAVIDQRIDVARSTLCDKVFETVINLVDTDISYTDYEARKRPAVEMSYSGGPVAQAIRMDGRFGDDGAFYLHDTSLAALARTFL